VRNTFAPQRNGTRITPAAHSPEGRVTGLAALADAVIIRLSGAEIASVPHALGRVYSAAGAAGAHILVISQSTAQGGISFAVAGAAAGRVVDNLHREFAEDLAQKRLAHIHVDQAFAMITAVGDNMRSADAANRISAALGRESVAIIAMAEGHSGCNVSAIVAQHHMRAALEAAHREFQLGRVDSEVLSDETEAGSATIRPVAWQYEPALGSANAD
jgi:aspartokinase